jgi:hypothetical protein
MREVIQMTFALWMIIISNATNGVVHVSDYRSLQECKQAAMDAAYIGTTNGSQIFSFVCIKNGSNL